MRQVRFATTRRARCVALFVLMLVLGPGAWPAHADELDTVLNILSTAGVIDHAVVEAKPLIQCLIDGKPLETCAKQAGAQAKGLLPNDPKIQKVVDVFKAVQAKDWLKVFLLAGEQVVCSMKPGGAVSDLFCTELFKVAKPVIAGAYQAVKSGDIVKLVALVGPEYACQLLPNAPGAGQLCGIIGDIAKGAADGMKALIPAALLTDLAEKWSGQTNAIPIEQYYLGFRHDLLHFGVLENVAIGGTPPINAKYNECVSYYDNHKMSKDNAQKVCGIMRDRIKQEIAATTQVVQAFPAAYFAGALAPKVPAWGQQYYYKIGADVPPGIAPAYYYECVAKFKGTIKLGPSPEQVNAGNKGFNPPDAQTWACRQVRGLLVTALQQEKGAVDAVGAKLKAIGCKYDTAFASSELVYYCPTYTTYRECGKLVPSSAPPDKRPCKLQQPAASQVLAKEIAATLGPKRCAVGEEMPGVGVKCTREWKRDACQNLVAVLTEGAPSMVACTLKGDPAYAAAKVKAHSILGMLNGVDPTARPVIGGARGPILPCRTLWDPLAISCLDVKTLQEMYPKLQAASVSACLPDPNRDGADVPCYLQKLTAQEATPMKPGVVLAPGHATTEPSTAARAGAPIEPPPATRQSWALAPPASLPPSAPAGARPTAPVGAPALHARELLIGGKPVEWGGALTLDARAATSARDGICHVPVTYTTRNGGAAPTGQLRSTWRNGSVPGTVTRTGGALMAGSTQTHTDVVPLRPGANVLHLTLADLGQATEPRDADLRVSVSLTGTCGAVAGEGVPAPGPGRSRVQPPPPVGRH